MSEENFARDLVRISDAIAKHGPINGLGDISLPPEIQHLAYGLCPRLFVESSISTAELLIIAMLFASSPQAGLHGRDGCLARSVLARLFGFSTTLRDQIALLLRLDERGMIECDRTALTYERTTRDVKTELPMTNIYTGNIKLTVYSYANIIRDEEFMYRERVKGFASNLDFLDAWAIMIDEIDWDWHDNPLNGSFQVQLSLSTIDSVHKQFDWIQKRLAATTVQIPFRTMIRDFELTREEQILIMYGVYHRERQGKLDSDGVRMAGVFSPTDSPLFMDRPILSRDSKLVQNQIFDHRVSEQDNRERQSFFLRSVFYAHIVGEMMLKQDVPIL